MFKKVKLDYEILDPLINKPFEKFKVDETKKYFEWYVNQIPTRIEYLKKKSGQELDLSFHSLIILWEWFIRVSRIEKIDKNRKLALREAIDNDVIKERQILSDERLQLSLETEYIIRDIAMYVGEVFTNYSNKICWGYYTDKKGEAFCNMPVLKGFEDMSFEHGFKMIFEPNHMVHVQAENILDKSAKKDDLYNMCMIWKSHIPQ